MMYIYIAARECKRIEWLIMYAYNHIIFFFRVCYVRALFCRTKISKARLETRDEVQRIFWPVYFSQ